MKKILILISMLVMLWLVVSCGPKVSDQELEKELSELSPEELEAVTSEEEGGAMSGLARANPKLITLRSAYKQRVAALKKTASPPACSDSDADSKAPTGLDLFEKGTVKWTGGQVGEDDTCVSEFLLRENYCSGTPTGIKLGKTVDCSDLTGPSGSSFKCVEGACVKQEQPEVSPPASLCGNGALEEDNNEYCDDGNLLNGDGCSDACLLEEGWTCPTNFEGAAPFSECKKMNQMVEQVDQTVCGDGKVQGVEECDDGASNGVVCSPVYGVESECGYCNKDCKTTVVKGGFCGDGVRQYEAEDCEDGNKNNGDGCSSSCKLEDIDLELTELVSTQMPYNDTHANVTLKATVKNAGTSNAGKFYVSFGVNATSVNVPWWYNIKVVPSEQWVWNGLAAGQSASVLGNFECEIGKESFKASSMADPKYAVWESKGKGNNQKQTGVIACTG